MNPSLERLVAQCHIPFVLSLNRPNRLLHHTDIQSGIDQPNSLAPEGKTSIGSNRDLAEIKIIK